MQDLLNALNPQSSLTVCSEPLREALQDISVNLTFDQNLQVFHPYYKTWLLPPEIQSRFHQLPPKSQQYHLFKHLRAYIYGVYYNSSLRPLLDPDRLEAPDASQLTNNLTSGVDSDLFQLLQVNNLGEGYLDQGWRILRIESDGAVAVTKNDLLIHINPEIHLDSSTSKLEPGQEIDIKMPKNRFQEGFYIAMSNLSGQDRPNSTTVRMYFNISVEGAPYLMREITGLLNNACIPFSFKLPYAKPNYHRNDTGVLYFFKSDYPTIKETIGGIYNSLKPYLNLETPLFTKSIAAGVGLAEEPDEHFESLESFGLNRCHIVTQALFHAAQNRIQSSEEKLQLIVNSFNNFNVDLAKPYLNKASEDIYEPI